MEVFTLCIKFGDLKFGNLTLDRQISIVHVCDPWSHTYKCKMHYGTCPLTAVALVYLTEQLMSMYSEVSFVGDIGKLSVLAVGVIEIKAFVEAL